MKSCSNKNCPNKNPQPLFEFYRHPTCKDGYLGQCKTCRKLYNTKYYEDNRDKIISNAVSWANKNKDKHNKYVSTWGKNNRDKTRRQGQKRRALKKQLPATLTVDEWQEILLLFNNSCAYCGTTGVKLEQEHVIPLSRGGGYTKDNIVPACKSCNLKKFNKTPEEARMTLL